MTTPNDHAALRTALNHETSSTIKQLQNELRREKKAHKREKEAHKRTRSMVTTTTQPGFCEVCDTNTGNVTWFRTPHSYRPGRNLYSACRVCVLEHAITGDILY